jgi:small subunit ribosomal protein S5
MANNRRNRRKRKYDQKVIDINRVSQKTKGGDKMGFNALVAVGDHKGKVGVGLGKAPSVLPAIKKGARLAKKNIIEVPIEEGTIPHELRIKEGAAKILLKPAPPGTGVIAGGPIRILADLAGIKNIVTKILGTRNKINNSYATIKAFQSFKSRKK